ncbi:MAG: hypothetical protein JSS21_06495 [Proteobacteria bacterium]|nr:hypothetical protein [Pseudomonadota bacterium]
MNRSRLLQGIGAIILFSIASTALASEDLTATRSRLVVVHTFSGTPDGIQPMGGLAKGPDGALYGATVYGGQYGYDPLDGANGNGTLFRISANNTYSVLYSFTHLQSDFSNVDGRWPDRALTIAPDGTLFGVTPYGGSADGGAAFAYAPATGFIAEDANFSALHYFGNLGNDPLGSSPEARPVVIADGTLLGTTKWGGLSGSGTLFRMGTDGTGYAVLQSFGNAAVVGAPNGNLLAASDGFLYGLAGTIGAQLYRTAPDGTQFSVLHTFDYATEGGFYYVGVIPAPTVGLDGYLYGATADGGGGGNGQGAIYRMAPDGNDFSVLHSFNPIDSHLANVGGARPRASLLVGNDGRMYGATQLGGPNGTGVLYRMEADGSAFTVLYSFQALSRRGANRSGAYPTGDIVFDNKGRLCGTAYAGGGKGFGTVYCLRLPVGG